MGRRRTMLGAARTRNPVVVYETLLDGLSETFDATSSARDRAQLANRIMDAQDRLCEMKGLMPAKPDEPGKHAEVTAFETISKRRTERRKAAEA